MKNYIWNLIWIGGASVLAIWLITGFGSAKFFDGDWSKSGEFGDTFGSVNALFSGFAFLGLIIAILMQREEIKLQGKQIELQKAEMRGSKEALQRQVEEMNLASMVHGYAEMMRAPSDVASHEYRKRAFRYLNETINVLIDIRPDLLRSKDT